MNYKKLLGGLALQAALAAGCTIDQRFATLPEEKLFSLDPSHENPPAVLQYLKPALAVRAAGCLMCHTSGLPSNVSNANVMTDFGYGDSWFWSVSDGYKDWSGSISGGSKPPNPPVLAATISQNWGSTAIQGGAVLVPKNARFPAQALGSTSHPDWTGVTFSLKEYLDRQAGGDVNGRFEVQEVSSLHIGAPSAETIRAAGNARLAGNAKLKFFKHAPSAPELSGLREEGTDSNRYYIADSSRSLVCAGDLVLDAPLYLKETSVETGNTGCRIYSTASVFVSGALRIVPAARGVDKQNVQITSSRGIFLGLGPQDGWDDRGNSGTPPGSCGSNSLHNRLNDGRFGNRLRIAPSEQTWTEYKNAVFADAALIPSLRGACGNSGYKEVSYERLLLNAPYVGGRYNKQFKGVIVAEIITWLPGKFAFEFDTVFTRVPALPLLDFKTILSVKE